MNQYFGKPAVSLVPTNAFLGPFSRVWARFWRKQTLVGARPDQLCILVTALRRDPTGRHSTHVLNSLRAQFALGKGSSSLAYIAVIPETLASAPVETPNALATAEARGRKWLRTQHADLLVWGEVGPDQTTLRLRFVAIGPQGLAPDGQLPPVPRPGAIAELEVPAKFGADYAALLAALILLGVEITGPSSRARIARLLTGAIARLWPLAEEPPEHFTAPQRARLWQTYALGEQRLDRERSDNGRLDAAVAKFKEVLEVTLRDDAPLDWGGLQRALGEALLRLGEREASVAHLEEAVAAFREALTVFTRLSAPQEWASLQHDLGVALWRLGNYTTGPARLEEAVAAFHLALEERPRERLPREWAETQGHLGAALAALGAREAGNERLQLAVGAYRDLLRTCERGDCPDEWATAQNNLGTALMNLGMRETSNHHFLEGITAFRAALSERPRQRAPLEWAATQCNLGSALALVGARENNRARLKEAVTVFNAALRVFNRESTPLDWAGAQNNLGSALASLGERENGTASLEEAIAAFRAALQEYTRVHKPLLWSEIQDGLGATIDYLGEPAPEYVRQREAAATRQTWAREHAAQDRARTQNNLGMALMTLAARQARLDPEVANRTLLAAREVMIGALEGRLRGGTADDIEEAKANLAEIDAALAKLGFGTGMKL